MPNFVGALLNGTVNSAPMSKIAEAVVLPVGLVVVAQAEAELHRNAECDAFASQRPARADADLGVGALRRCHHQPDRSTRRRRIPYGANLLACATLNANSFTVPNEPFGLVYEVKNGVIVMPLPTPSVEHYVEVFLVVALLVGRACARGPCVNTVPDPEVNTAAFAACRWNRARSLHRRRRTS